VNAPLQIYYAYNPLRLYKDLPTQLALPSCPANLTQQQCFFTYFPTTDAGKFSAAQAYQFYGADYQLREPRKTFRFTVSTSF
jgi:outer membrane protein insertion porin family